MRTVIQFLGTGYVMKRCLLAVCLVMLLVSCSRKAAGESAFEDKVMLLESNPEQFLAKLDTTAAALNIHTVQGATSFLLKSMAQSHLNEDVCLDKEKMLQCETLFGKREEGGKQLETLFLLARAYHKENNLESEVAIINKALEKAVAMKDNRWLFYLYCYLSDISIRDLDVLKYIKYQTLAAEALTDEEVLHTDIYAKMLMGKNCIYTNQFEKAIGLLLEINQSMSEKHAYYADCLCLLGVAYFKSEQWNACIQWTNKALEVVRTDERKFICYSILTYCYYNKGEVAMARTCRDQAIRYDRQDETNHMEIEFYKVCADFSKDNQNIEGEIDCLRKVIERYEQKVQKLNGKTLDGAVQAYAHVCEKNKYEQQLNIYQYAAFFVVVVLLGAGIVYVNRQKKQAYHLLALQQQIHELESLERIKEETKEMILRDMEVAKRVATLKQTRKEKGEKLLQEIDKLNLLSGNKLVNTQWNDFYRQIDISFDGFYHKLIEKYASLNDKEVQLCCLLAAGFRTDEIAAVWGQSVYTVHKCKTNIRKKTEAPEGSDILVFLQNELH